MPCSAECGPQSAQPGEFNFASSDFCDIEFLGRLSLNECDSDCANGGFVACDRFDGPVNGVGSCYGYFEVTPGACSMRNDNFAWMSWLTCRLDGIPVPGAHLQIPFVELLCLGHVNSCIVEL